MADSSANDSCEHIEDAEDNPDNGTSNSPEVGEHSAQVETTIYNDIGKDTQAPNPRVGSIPADEDVAGAVALDATPPSPLDFSSRDSEKVELDMGASALSDNRPNREFRGAAIYPEVCKSNLTPSNFQASLAVLLRYASPDIATYLTPIT